MVRSLSFGFYIKDLIDILFIYIQLNIKIQSKNSLIFFYFERLPFKKFLAKNSITLWSLKSLKKMTNNKWIDAI